MDSQAIVTGHADPHEGHEEHPAYLRHHFVTVEQQRETASFGMWLFLLTEIMFFGGMFGAYTVYRTMYPAAFHTTSQFMDPMWGCINTIVLIVSSLSMALAVRAARLGQQKALQLLLIVTMIFRKFVRIAMQCKNPLGSD